MIVRAQRSKRWAKFEQEEIVAAYLGGTSANALAKKYGSTRKGVCALLEREGVARRYNVLTHDDVRRAEVLYAQGRSLGSLAEEFGVAAQTVALALRKAGVEMRPVGTNQWK